tara:strand:- start:2565 stop:3275 length:711 start_codon:yes stop_codon:yes gene_type:complete
MATTKTITDFKSKLAGGGARSNLFEVSIPSFPSGVTGTWGSGDDEENGIFKFLCKATNLPASNIGLVSVPFRGRILKVAGDRTVDDWSVTVINDEDFKLRTAFEKWANAMSKLDDATGISNPTSYMTNAFVKQLGRGATPFSVENEGSNSSVLRTYKFYDIFPTTVSAITLSYDNTNAEPEQFDVTFAVQYFSVGESDEVAQGQTPGDEGGAGDGGAGGTPENTSTSSTSGQVFIS